MRVALVTSGLPPYARNPVEAHAAALASALAAGGATVEVCATRPLPGLAPLAQRREERDAYAVTWINVDPASPPDEQERADAFAAFLDRERPDVVHFEDVAHIGIEAVLEVEGRGIPAVFTAHDWFAVSDQARLLAPDGSPFQPDDREREARMALARAALETEDPTDVLLGSEVGPIARGLLQVEATTDAREVVRARLERKKAAFSMFAARYAATKHLARRLSATLGRAVDWRAPGVDLTPYAAARLRRREGPLRLGYLGPLGRADGVHLLLEAFAGLEPGVATLVLHGDTEERSHLRRLRARAGELGVDWGGPYRAEDTARLLAEVDVRVLPALWDGGSALAALEAQAAQRPVIAPRHEGLLDLVRDDVDGLLFEPGDAASLLSALQRFAAGDLPTERFELALRAPRDVRTEAREWLEAYTEVVEARARRRPSPDLPAHLAPFAERHDRLAALSTRDLLGQVLAGLEVLGGQMGLTAGARDLLLVAAGRGSGLRDAAMADRRVIDRLQRSVDRLADARTELEERAGWHAAQLGELSTRLEEREQALSSLGGEVAAARRARDELAAEKAADDEERARLEDALAERLAAARALEDDLLTTRRTHARLEEERDHLDRTLQESAQELRFLRERVAGELQDEGLADSVAIEQHFETLERELGGLRDHESWLRGEVGALLDGVVAAAEEEGAGGLQAGRAGFERLARELEWRREEMAAARAASQRLFTRLVGGGLVDRVRTWEEGNP